MADTILYGNTNQAAILTNSIQGPSGSLASPTGTGYVHVTGGTVDGAAQAVNLAGGSTYVTGVLPMANMASPTGTGVALVTAGAMNAAAGPIPLGGGASYVTGLLPVANVAPAGTNGYVLTTTGGVAVWSAATGITALTSDVTASGTGSVAATVVAVHGATVPAAGALTTGNVLQVTGASALGYAAVNLAGGANYVTGILPTANQASQSLSGDATGTTAAVVVTQAQAGAFSFGPSTGTITTNYATTAPGLAQTSTSAATAYNMVLSPQASTNTNGTPGSLLINIAAATGTGSEGNVTIQRNGVQRLVIGALPSNVSYNAITFGAGTPSVSNYAFLQDQAGTFTSIQGPGLLQFLVSNVVEQAINSSGIQFFNAGTFGLGGGVGVIGIGKAATNPSTSVSTGSVIYSDHTSGALCFYPAGVTTPTLSVGTNPTTNGGAGVLILNPATTNPSASLTNQGVIYFDSTSGGICLYPSTVTGCVLNANTNGVYMVGSATIQNGLSCTGGLGGIAPSPPVAGFIAAPFSWAQTTTAISFGTGGTVVVSAAQAATPGLTLTSGVLAAAAILDFSTWGVTGFWVIDASGVGAGTFPLSFKNGTKTVSLSTLPVGGLVLVRTWGTNNIAVN